MNNERLYSILRAPHISEKSSLIQAHGNQYVFRVAIDANKPEVKAAIEKMFDVSVENVNMVKVRGKTKSFKLRQGKRPDWKKAYVRIQAGQSIDVDAVSE